MKTHLLYCINTGTLCTVHSIPYSSDVGSGCHVYTLRVPIFEIADCGVRGSLFIGYKNYWSNHGPPIESSLLFGVHRGPPI